MTPAIRFAKDECLDLPDVMYQTRDVELTAQANKYYKELKLYKIQKGLNLILRLLPLIPVSGFLLGYGVII